MKISTIISTILLIHPLHALIETSIHKQNTVAENEYVSPALSALQYTTPYKELDTLPSLSGMDIAHLQLPTVDNPFGPSGTSIVDKANGSKVTVDARTGVVSSISMSKPILPGAGTGNTLLWSIGELPGSDHDNGKAHGSSKHHELLQLSHDVVKNWFDENQHLLGIESKSQLFSAGRTRMAIHGNEGEGGDMIQMSIQRTFHNIPVLGSRATATIKLGNLINVGLENWGTIPDDFDVEPSITVEEAFVALSDFAGRDYVRGQESCKPELLILALAKGVDDDNNIAPSANDGVANGTPFSEVNGLLNGIESSDVVSSTKVFQLRGQRETKAGKEKEESSDSNNNDNNINANNASIEEYTYTLIWKICPIFESQNQEIMQGYVNAHTSQVYSFLDTVDYFSATGSVYPTSNDGIGQDGALQENWPMPFMQVGSEVTDTGGNYLQAGSVVAKLSGKYVEMKDFCNNQNVAEVVQSDGINWGGSSVRADTGADCETPGYGTDSNTHSSRTGFYELNKIMEIARSRLPENNWLKGRLVARMNINNYCNAFWNGSTINFYRAGGVCGNTGEIAGIFDHEWGHGMDQNDVVGGISGPSGEGIADLYTALRLNDSCIGRGFFVTGLKCSTGGDCKTCTGVRDIDQAEKTTGGPWTQSISNAKCNGSTHCIGVVYSEAVWDLYKRKLQQAPYNYDENTALEVVTRLTYIAAGNIQSWFSGTPGSSGCGSQSGYHAFLGADDDDGNLNNGTPHMQAIYEAFNDHEIACHDIPVIDSGCPNNPQEKPIVTVSPGNMAVQLSWTPVANAVKYQVLRTEGVSQCSQGKVLLGETTDLTFSDSGLSNGRDYHYIVVPKGDNDACYGPSSDCATIAPSEEADFTMACLDNGIIDFDANQVPASVSRECLITAYGGWSGAISVGCTPSSDLQGIQCEGYSVSISPGQTTATTTITVEAVSGAQISSGIVTINAQSGSIARSSILNVVVFGASGPQEAIFEGGSPICKLYGSSCDSMNLLDGRGGNVGPEVNAPNTRDGCSDGVAGTYHSDESLDRIVVTSTDGNDMKVGSTVQVTATVWAWSTGGSDFADFFYASNAANPVWQHIGTLQPSGGGAQQISMEYTLPEGTFQAVRVTYRYMGAVTTCSAGNYDESDDLVFKVQPSTMGDFGAPTNVPSQKPTPVPTAHPTSLPTSAPSALPTPAPTAKPSFTPTAKPSTKPSATPTAKPTAKPSAKPSVNPTMKPTPQPNPQPTHNPTNGPTLFPTRAPTNVPTNIPTIEPSNAPSMAPTNVPTKVPTNVPSHTPSLLPSLLHSSAPSLSIRPSLSPSYSPTSSPVSNNGPQLAVFDDTLGAPRCFDVGSECSGGGLMEGRGNVGPESSSPNTIDGCVDGAVGTYQSDESIEKIVVRSGDIDSLGSEDLTEGRRAHIIATVHAWSSGQDDRADFFYAADASNPSWEFIGTIIPPSGGLQELKMAYTLPVGQVQAVRVGFRYKGSRSTCTTGNYNDRDDLIITVASGTSAPTKAPTPVNHAATFDDVLGIPICVKFGNSCDSVDLLESRGAMNGRSELNAPNTLDTCTDGSVGKYHSDESIDRIVVRSGEVDGSGSDTELTEGGRATISAFVFAWGTGQSDSADFYYTNDFQSPTWTYIDTVVPSGGGLQELKVSYELPAGEMQAVRVNFRYRGSASPCSNGNYDDHDDLGFKVSPNTSAHAVKSRPVETQTKDDIEKQYVEPDKNLKDDSKKKKKNGKAKKRTKVRFL